jgi:hypothetical protein
LSRRDGRLKLKELAAGRYYLRLKTLSITDAYYNASLSYKASKK